MMPEAIQQPDPSLSREQRYALVVGVNGASKMPHLSPLKGAEENARTVANILQEHCGCTLLCEPLLGAAATTGAVRQALNTLAQKRTDNDLLLFYFAGHGSIHEDTAEQRSVFLVTSDFDASLIEDDEATDSISLGLLQERLYEKTKAGRVILLLDCCYAGNAGNTRYDLPLDTMAALFKHYLGATTRTSQGKYRITLAATGYDGEAGEYENDGIMTKHLLAALRGDCVDAMDQDGRVTIGRLYDHLHNVMPATQKPSFSGDTVGRGVVLAMFHEHSAQARRAQQQIVQQQQRYEYLHVLSVAPEGERILRDRLESFVGREAELHAIQQQIATVRSSGGYVTITGQAGQGKSSIIAALIARYAVTPEERERIPFHFIPFNPGPEYQVSVLRNLMARLILKYDLSDLYVASESRPALRDFFPKVLSEIAAKGGQEIIFIDGLDQIESDLNGVRDLSFLPTNPPAGIVFVLGTRPDDTLKPLTLLKPTQYYLLPPLSREDFSTLLQRRQVPPLQPRLADQFYEKMQQNALYLDLLARELHNQGSIMPDAIETIIHRLAEDPNNIFSLALERLERHREDWDEVIKPLLGALLVAYEPLTPWQLRTILHLDHRRVQNGLQYLSGLVTNLEQRYALYHLKLQDFLRQNEAQPHKAFVFAIDEEAEYHGKFVQWCERDQLSLIWEESKDPNEQSRRRYARHHYISHLYAAHQWEHLFAVLDEQSYGQAKERYDIGTRSYVQDLRKGSLAATWDGWTDEQQVKYLPYHWRYTLLRCSIRSTADQYPLELFKAMLMLGKEREVAGLIELITVSYKKVEVLLLLAQHLFQLPERKQEGAAMYMQAEVVARSIKDADIQGKALAALATALAHEQQWERAEVVARSIEDADIRGKALVDLATALAHEQQWERAEVVARSIEDADIRGKALADLATALAHEQQWERAEVVARSIEDADIRGKALADLATALAHEQQWERAEVVARSIKRPDKREETLAALVTALAHEHLWERAKEIARSLKRPDTQARVLTVLAAALAHEQRWEQATRMFSLAEEIARSIKRPDAQARALTALATALAHEQQWERAEVVARSIEDADIRGKALVDLATALAHEQQWERAEVVARSIEDADIRGKALADLATALAHEQQWERAEVVARSIEDADIRGKALAALVTALAHEHLWERAEEIARSLKQPGKQAIALTALATTLAREQRWEQAARTFSLAEETAHSLKETSGTLRLRGEALAALATALAQGQQWERAEEIARSIKGSYEQARALATLATALAHEHLWKRAEEIARSIERSYEQARALATLATALAHEHLWEHAEEIARSIEWLDARARALIDLATALAYEHLWEQANRTFSLAKETARSIKEASSVLDLRGEVLVALTIALAQEQQWEHAEEIARSIEESDKREEALAALATALAQGQQWERAEEIARSLNRSNKQARVLTVLATALAQEQQWERAEEIARSIEESDKRGETLVALATALAQGQQWERAEEIARSIEESSLQAWALATLATALAHEQQWERAEEIARSLKRSDAQARALATLATALAQGQQWERAEEIARSIEESDKRGEALAILVTALAHEHLWERAEEIARSLKRPDAQARVLTALATALAQEQQWERAEEIARSIEESDKRGEALAALATALAQVQQWELKHSTHLLSLVQRSWLRAETRDEALRLFSLASGLVTHLPTLGMELYQAFQWTDDFSREG